MNVLTQPFETKYQTAPFSKINNQDFIPALKFHIEAAKKSIASISQNTEAPNFENTLEVLEFATSDLERVSSVFYNLYAAHCDSEIEAIAKEFSPLLTAFQNDIMLDEALFFRVKSIYDDRNELSLDAESMTLLDKTYKSFIRNGALLNEADKAKLRSIDESLSLHGLSFSQNALAEVNAYFLQVSDESRIKGIPQGALDRAAQEAKNRDLKGWVFTLQMPSYIPVMTYAQDRALREELNRAYGKIANQDNEHNNHENIKKIVALRHERAKLLGYESHAAYVLEERMAKSTQGVMRFLEDLLEKSKPAAEREINEIKAFAKEKEGIEDLMQWDSSYFNELMKQSLFDLDSEALRPYFKLDNVLQGAFEIANRLFGLSFRKVTDIDVYHPEVDTYEVYDEQNEFKAIFYTDFFPRASKKSGAWMTSFKDQYHYQGENSRPHIAIVCNFTPPNEDKPSLLTFDEVSTLFHEFGHALHGMLADTKYPSLSGTHVFWDFVELPSQIMENWCEQSEALQLFAKHYETGEIIPQEFIEKIKKSSQFMQGLATLRQLSLGFLDMAYHGQEQMVHDIKAFETEATTRTRLLPIIPESLISTNFSHIFAGGYSSGYYSYKWAEVLDADAFEYFLESGIFNKNIAQKFKDHILSQGGTRHPMELYKAFRGQEPKVDALLKRSGLVSAS
ncbi:MAG: M3 family metallopeptidase [Chitinophagales bacterium]|jgi:peptidyl-dipeptidase Dcp|nr:M3 family metallopeptidase [Chitinophagales bacterium]